MEGGAGVGARGGHQSAARLRKNPTAPEKTAMPTKPGSVNSGSLRSTARHGTVTAQSQRSHSAAQCICHERVEQTIEQTMLSGRAGCADRAAGNAF